MIEVVIEMGGSAGMESNTELAPQTEAINSMAELFKCAQVLSDRVSKDPNNEIRYSIQGEGHTLE